jgi:hypothetical protein
MPLPVFTPAVIAAPPQKATAAKPAAKPAPKKPAPPAEKPAFTPAFPNTAEGAVRGLLVSMMNGDAAAVRAVVLPVPAADLKLLLGGSGQSSLTPEQRAQALPFVAGMPIHAMLPGESVDLPGAPGEKLTVTPDMVGEDRAVLLPQRFPQPFVVRRVSGTWRVDAAPLIAARRAAAKAAAAQAAPKP